MHHHDNRPELLSCSARLTTSLSAPLDSIAVSVPLQTVAMVVSFVVHALELAIAAASTCIGWVPPVILIVLRAPELESEEKIGSEVDAGKVLCCSISVGIGMWVTSATTL